MISKKEVEHIANLSRLSLSSQEIKKMEKDLSAILGYFDSLKKVDIREIEPTSHPVLIENIMREDVVKEQSTEKANKLLKAVPKKEGRYVKVKSIL